MNGLRPIVGRQYQARTFCARTAIEAFGTPFVVQRGVNWDRVIGYACAAIIIGVIAGFLAGKL